MTRSVFQVHYPVNKHCAYLGNIFVASIIGFMNQARLLTPFTFTAFLQWSNKYEIYNLYCVWYIHLCYLHDDSRTIVYCSLDTIWYMKCYQQQIKSNLNDLGHVRIYPIQ